jgi:hypothetical protein
MRTRLAALALATSLSFGCSKSKDAAPNAGDFGRQSVATKGVEAAKPTDVDDKLGNPPAVDPNRKVIRTGQISLVVTTYDEARAKLDALLEAAGGYVDSTQVQHYQGAVSSATLVLRIPQDAFGTLVPKLRELGEISSESTNAEDVTDQYVDIAARLASSKTLEKRLLELAADRSSGVEALLAVERELARVRGEIESYEGRMRQWNDQIAMSTLTLSVSTKGPAIAAVPEPGLRSQIASGFHGSIDALQTFATWLAVTATSLLPWMILLVPGFIFGRRAYRRYARQLPAAIVHSAPPQPPAA